MRVEGAGVVPEIVRADDTGRLEIMVDLGPAHTLEQGTDAELVAEAATPTYFVTRDVRFRALDRDDGGCQGDR